MTSALLPSDPELLAVIDRYRTCEFATLSRSGVPIAWPTVPLRLPDGTLLITTSIALSRKAYNIRRDGRVALLFSEPTASGLTGAPELLLQGTATCPDEVVTDIRAHADYWQRLHERQPANAMYSNNPISRRMFDWYYMRLLITVTPSGWSARPPLPPGAATSTDAAPGGTAGEALGRLATFPSAVLGTRDPDGAPRLRRIRVTGPSGGALALSIREDDDDLVPGPASLLAHSHDDRLWSQRSTVVLGALARAGAGVGWTFQPERIIGGLGDGGPLALVRMIRELRRTAQGYLERRSLPRPQIAWADLKEVKAGLRGAGTERRQEPAGGPPSSP